MSGTVRPLQVSDLVITRSADGARVIDEVAFAVGAGEITGLVGESGCGKTTVALAALGFVRQGLRVAGGCVAVNGRDVFSLSRRELRKLRGRSIAYVPQDPAVALNPALRVATQVRETLAAHGVAKGEVSRRVTEVMIAAGLPDPEQVAPRYPHQLSGGQQQRVAIAMAFACLPQVIVLDEPTTGLDVSTQRRVLDTVRRYSRQSGVACVYVTHDLATVSQVADNLCVMYAGKVVEAGLTRAVFRAPEHPYTAGLLEAIPSSDERVALRGIAGRPPAPGAWARGCAYLGRCKLASDVCRDRVPPLTGGDTDDQLSRCFHKTDVATHPRALRHNAPKVVVKDGCLVVDCVRAEYDEKAILDDTSFMVQPGRCLAVVGETGAGKTTLARCIVGLLRPSHGAISLGSTPLAGRITERRAAEARAIQYIFQNPYASLNSRQSVGAIVAAPLREFEPQLSKSERDRRVIQALEDAALSGEFARRDVHGLSGGERQRVAIARAIAVRPAFLVCDEITSALDVSVQAVIVTLLDDLRERFGLGLVFVTHDLGLVNTIADEVLVLKDGITVETGSVDEVLRSPTSEYGKALLRDTPNLDGFGGSQQQVQRS